MIKLFMVKKALFLFLGFIFALIGLEQISYAQNEVDNADRPTAKVEIANVKILPAEEGLEIRAELFNSSEKIGIPRLTYLILLKNIDPFIKPTKEPNLLLPSLVVSVQEGAEFFSLKPLEKKEALYRLPVTDFLPNANYEFSLIIIDQHGEMLGSHKEILYNFGLNRQENKSYFEPFLAFDQENCFLITPDGKRHGYNNGPIFEPGESPRIQCLVKNLSGASVEVYPKVEWKEFYIYGNPSGSAKREQKINNLISFKPKEEKLVDIFLPGEDRPQVYQSFLSFEDKNGNPVSLNMFFRWIIRGQSARIKEVVQTSVLKNTYKEKEKISLLVRYFGSADLSRQGMDEKVSEISDFKMAVEIKNKNGERCGQSEISLPEAKGGGLMEQSVDVFMSKKCEGASYAVSLLSGGEKLAEENGVFPLLKEKGFLGYLWLAPILALLAILAAVKIRKKRLSSNVIIAGFFATILSLGIFGGGAMADVVNPPNESSIGFRAGVNGYAGQMFSGASYGGEYNKTSDVLYSGWHKFISADSNNWNKFKLKPDNNGKTVTADFTDYFDWQKRGALKLYVNHKPIDASSGKTSMMVKIKALMKTGSMDDDDYERQKIKIAPEGSRNFSENGYLIFNYDAADPLSVPNNFVLYPGEPNSCSNNICSTSINSSVEFFLQYDDANRTWRPKTDSRLVVNFKQFGAGNDSQGEFYYPGDFDQEIVYDSGREVKEKNAREKSDRIKVKIPLNLPNPTPKVLSFTASPSSVDAAENKITLTWKTEDVDYCNITATNNAGSYSIKTSNGSADLPSSGTTYTGTAYDNNIKKTTNYALQCKKYFGTAIGEIAYPPSSLLASVSVISPTYLLTINKTGIGSGTVEIRTTQEEKDVTNTVGTFPATSGPYNSGTDVTLTANPNSGFLANWTACPSIKGNVCSVTMDAAKSVTVNFGTASCSATPDKALLHQEVLWTATQSGGDGPWAYDWNGAAEPDLSSNFDDPVSVSKKYTTTGTITASVRIKDATGDITTSPACSATVSTMTASCSASPNPVLVNTSTTFTATASGGATPYTYSWSGDDGLSGTTNPITKTYTTTGTKNATITVKDKSGSAQATNACAVTVSPPPLICPNGDCDGTDQCGSTNNACVSGTWSDTPDSSTQYLWSCGAANCALNIVIPPPNTLTVKILGSGSGIISDTNGAKDANGNVQDPLCLGSGGTICSISYADGTSLKLSVSAYEDNNFDSWGDSCSGQGDCSVTMDGDKTVSASFGKTDTPYPCPPYCDGGGSSSSEDGVNPSSSSSPSSGGPISISSSKETILATIVENLPANSDKAILSVDTGGVSFNENVSVSFIATGSFPGTAVFSPSSVNITKGATSADAPVEFYVKNIPGTTTPKQYEINITANYTTTDGSFVATKTIKLNVEKITATWREI